MARFLSNKRKYLRRFGIPSSSEAETTSRPRPAKRKTDFGVQLEEKQKLKFVYGILERQLQRYARQAFWRSGDPREILLRQLETRLDNVVYRLGFATTRQQARQLVSHRHVLVNNRKLNIPSYAVQSGDSIALSQKASQFINQQDVDSRVPLTSIPGWLELSEDHLTGIVRHLPNQEEMPQDINMQYVIEFLSKRMKR